MTFKEAVEKTPPLRDAWCKGLAALRSTDRRRVATEDTQRLTGSVNLDAALAQTHPNDPRWDYAVGHRPINLHGEMVYWIEIHPARQSDIEAVLKKVEWLKNWLVHSAPRLQAMRKAFVWVSSGNTSFNPHSPQAKRLAQAGVRHRGRVFKIPNNASA